MCTASVLTASINLVREDQTMLEDPGGMEEQTEELVGPREMEDQEEMEEIKIKELPEEMVEERTVNMKSKSKMERYQELLEKTIQIIL